MQPLIKTTHKAPKAGGRFTSPLILLRLLPRRWARNKYARSCGNVGMCVKRETKNNRGARARCECVVALAFEIAIMKSQNHGQRGYKYNKPQLTADAYLPPHWSTERCKV